MDTRLYFQMSLYILGIIALISLIVLEIKLYFLEKKVDKILDDLKIEVKHFNETFTRFSNKLNITKNIYSTISNIISKLFYRKNVKIGN